MKPPSIRRALLIRCGIGIGVLLCLLSIGIYIQVRRGLYRELDRSLYQTAALLGNQIEYEGGKIIFEWQEGSGESGHFLSDALYEYWNESSGEITRSPGLKSQENLPRFSGPNGLPEIRDIHVPSNKRHARAIGMRVYPFIIPEEIERMRLNGNIVDPKSLPHILVVARDAKSVHRILTRVRWILASGTLATLVIGYLMMELAIRISLRPIHTLSCEVYSRSGNPDDSTAGLPADLPSELTGIVESFEALLTRVSVIRDRERDFIRHAAHELRTPIAGLRATTDLALSKSRDATDYAAHLTTCRQTVIELGELVKRLTALARIDQRSAPPTLQAVNFTAIMDESLIRFQPLFDQRNLKIHRLTEPTIDAQVSGDNTLIRIILNNLLDNARVYAPEGSEIMIRTQLSKESVELSIANPADMRSIDLARLFEPLFRHEESRHDAESHLGIGLTLSLDAARSMGGTLIATKTPEGWIEFVLSLPQAVT